MPRSREAVTPASGEKRASTVPRGVALLGRFARYMDCRTLDGSQMLELRIHFILRRGGVGACVTRATVGMMGYFGKIRKLRTTRERMFPLLLSLYALYKAAQAECIAKNGDSRLVRRKPLFNPSKPFPFES